MIISHYFRFYTCGKSQPEKDSNDDNSNDSNYQGKQDYPFNSSMEKKKTGHV